MERDKGRVWGVMACHCVDVLGDEADMTAAGGRWLGAVAWTCEGGRERESDWEEGQVSRGERRAELDDAGGLNSGDFRLSELIAELLSWRCAL
jgi:hypothetical protein